jgi:tRNA(Ile)-lysidine synthase
MSDRTLEKVLKFISANNMFGQHDRVLAGISGGADSTCLLMILCELRDIMGIRPEVVHINHGVRAEAGEDAEFVRNLCAGMGVPFTLREIDMDGYARKNGLSSEEAGRILRYGIFREIMEKEGIAVTAVAHNSNDRAETVMFNLMRGTGLKGMCGIEPVHGDIVRPLLCLDRTEIERYLADRHQTYVTDRTNLGDDYARNRIRHHILAYAEEEICRGTVRHLNETADMLTEVQSYIDRQTDAAYASCAGKCADGIVIDTDRLMAEDIVIRKNVILRCFEGMTPHRKDITQVHVSQVLGLAGTPGSRKVSLPYGLTARTEYGRLFILRSDEDTRNEENTDDCIKVPDPPCTVMVPGRGECACRLITGTCFKADNIPENKYTKFFDYDKITSCLLWRRRQPGDYLTVDDLMHRKSLKGYMIDEKIPQHLRGSVYMLADGNHIVWLPGYRISAYYRVSAGTSRVLEMRLQTEDDQQNLDGGL